MELLITTTGDKKFKISVPDDSKLTFAPWSPPKKNEYRDRDTLRGTLRIYNKAGSIIACFSDIISFRDTSIEFAEEVVKEEGAVVWKSDKHGYYKEEKASSKREWEHPQLTTGKKGKARGPDRS